jgi:phosphomannomutase
VAQATADFWKSTPVAGTEERAVVGYDRRFLSDKFAARTAEILAGNGFEVTLTSDRPDARGIVYGQSARAVGGVMVTASHNPPIFNGFKLKAYYGGSADPAICQAIEKRLDQIPSGLEPRPGGPRSTGCHPTDPPRALPGNQEIGGFPAHREVETLLCPRRFIRSRRWLF